MKKGSLMKVESIEEIVKVESIEEILQYFRPSLSFF